MAIDPKAVYQSPQAESYEQYVRENWDSLAPWEQKQAQDFLEARNNPYAVEAPRIIPPRADQPFLNATPKLNAHPELYWTVKCAWICTVGTIASPFFFGPLGVFFGVYNVWKGEEEKGLIQLSVTILIFVVMIIMLLALQDIAGSLIIGPEVLG